MKLVSHNIEEFLKKDHSGKLVYLQPGEMWQVNDLWETPDGPEVMTQERLDFLSHELGRPFTCISEFMMQFKPRRYVGAN